MALTRIDTGEQATPLSEIEKRTDAYKDMTDNQLLREALAKSSVNCNELIKTQNSLVKGLTEEVKSLKENNEYEMSQTKFGVEMKKRYRSKMNSSGRIAYKGLIMEPKVVQYRNDYSGYV